jgi:hypothetical protein
VSINQLPLAKFELQIAIHCAAAKIATYFQPTDCEVQSSRWFPDGSVKATSLAVSVI